MMVASAPLSAQTVLRTVTPNFTLNGTLDDVPEAEGTVDFLLVGSGFA